MEKDNRQPVEQRHIDFGRDIVALARKHAMRSIRVEFYGGQIGEPWTRVTMDWSEGRHGAASSLSFKAEAIHRCKENPDG